MELAQTRVGVPQVQDRIRGGQEGGPEPIACLKKAEAPEWRLDGCRFLLLSSQHVALDQRQRSHLLEAAAMALVSVFDLLLQELAKYYGLDKQFLPKEILWNVKFRQQLRAVDPALEALLESERQTPWMRKAMGLRHYLTHIDVLLQHVKLTIPNGLQTYSILDDPYFDSKRDIQRPDSFEDGRIDRAALYLEVADALERMCRLVDKARMHCFEHAPAFRRI
jgi:hypothetical protein